jgi:predicted unusual protein kinase regulating ubiquinone biosynthesis (AarF/ABC1/UbiB family)
MTKDDAGRAAVVSSPVPSGRWERLARLGGLATMVAGGMLAEGARQLGQGKRPKMSDLLLTPANVRRVADQLSQLRGAAMKVGQLISMDAGDLLPPELAQILARLRADATAMPKRQVISVLTANWGPGWAQRHFTHFSFIPLAAASIGQVHEARSHDGRRLAIKVQYPGVRQSIDSDVDNVATLLKMSGLLPRDLDIAPLLLEAKQQLHDEADYLQEGAYLQRYAALLAASPDFALPALQADLTTRSVLAMSFVGGVPIEQLAQATQAVRNRAAELLVRLLLREIFEFQLVQTDPNFANYRYDLTTQQLILLDFGATRPYATQMVDNLRDLMAAALSDDTVGMTEVAIALGYFDRQTLDHHRQAVLSLFSLACEPLRCQGAYDFGRSDLALRLRQAGLALGRSRDFWHIPPVNLLFLHRKLGGLYLLAARLKAQVNVQQLVQDFLQPVRLRGVKPGAADARL